MGKFEDSIPAYIEDIKKQVTALNYESYQLDWGHECDCDFCDEEATPPPETIEREAQLKIEIKDRLTMIKRLERHAELYGGITNG